MIIETVRNREVKLRRDKYLDNTVTRIPAHGNCVVCGLALLPKERSKCSICEVEEKRQRRLDGLD